MFQDLMEKIRKTNDQRVKMMFTLINVMQSKNATLELKSAVAASVMEMLEHSMLPEDITLVELLNESVNVVCKEAENAGINNLKESLQKIIITSKEKAERIIEGESIIKNINLN